MSACPDGDEGQQFTVVRTVTVAEDFDETGWMGDLVERYQARDRWTANRAALCQRSIEVGGRSGAV